MGDKMEHRFSTKIIFDEKIGIQNGSRRVDLLKVVFVMVNSEHRLPSSNIFFDELNYRRNRSVFVFVSVLKKQGCTVGTISVKVRFEMHFRYGTRGNRGNFPAQMLKSGEF